MANDQTCCKLLRNVDEASFFMQELKLYLDTHPYDKEAIALFKEACRQYKQSKEAFEASCYPLQACDSRDCDRWDWLCGSLQPERI